METPNNVIGVPIKSDIEFFKKWLVITAPLHNMSELETKAAAEFLKIRHETALKTSDDELISQIVFSKQSRKKVRENLGVSVGSFNMLFKKLMKKKFVVKGNINKMFIPNTVNIEQPFTLMFYFKREQSERDI